MLEKATITMPYKELEELLIEIETLKEKVKNIPDEMNIEDFEKNPFKRCLDGMFDLMEKASKLTKANEKQYFIYAIMKMYCDIFEIPIKELLEDVPRGTEPK